MAAIQTESELIAIYLEPSPTSGDPAEWRVKERGVPIWALISWLLPDGSNATQVAADYGISAESMAAAQTYYRRHRELIDARLVSNRTA